MNTAQSLRTALEAASLALSASHNLTVTDRSDLPRAEWPVYVTDHRAELALIDGALRDLGKLSTDNGPVCSRCKKSLSRTSA